VSNGTRRSWCARGALGIGGGFGFGLLWVSSVTADAPSMVPTLEFGVLTSLDIVRFSPRGSALYVGVKLWGSMVLANDATPVFWGPSGVLGVRL
jgi:hypothetical protein